MKMSNLLFYVLSMLFVGFDLIKKFRLHFAKKANIMNFMAHPIYILILCLLKLVYVRVEYD